MNYLLKPETAHINVSPTLFHKWAEDCYKCKHDFRVPGRFSPVPYFLLCRAIELELKSKHLQQMNQRVVKRTFSHNLIKSYKALPKAYQVLDKVEFDTLSAANKIYVGRGFEYSQPADAAQGYSGFPTLDVLDAVAKKLLAQSKDLGDKPQS